MSRGGAQYLRERASRPAAQQTSVLRRLAIGVGSGRAAIRERVMRERFIEDGTGTAEEYNAALLALESAGRLELFDGWVALVIPQPEPGSITSEIDMPDGTVFVIVWQPE